MHYFEEWTLPEERGTIPYFETLPEYLEFIVGKYADQTALSDPERSFTYAQMGERIARKRGFLKQQGLAGGGNIGLLDVNSIDAVEWFLAITTAGFTAVMLPAQLAPEVLAGASMLYELKAVIAGEVLMPKTAGVKAPVYPTASEADLEPAAHVTKKTPAAIFFTGGTTGQPKGVILNHGAVVRGPHNGTYRDRHTMFGAVEVCALPLTHVFGMVFSTLSPLYAGGHVAMCAQMRDLFKEMMRVKPNTMVAVPGMAEIMLGIAKMRGFAALGGNLKLVICGAAPVPPRLREGFKAFGVSVLAGYGMTETANLVCANFEMDRDPYSVGRQYPEQEMRLVDGELQVKGDMLFDGYWKNPEATKAAFTEDGWLRTGDLARVDDEGFITIVGRIKNLIILPNGENVSPEEVEDNYYRSPMVKDCLVYEAEVAGTPAIVIEIQPMDGVTDDDMQKEASRIAGLLPTTMRPARVIVRHEDFIKSPSMKIVRGQQGGKKQ